MNHHSAIEDYTFRYEYIFTLAETIQTLVTSISLLLKDKTEEVWLLVSVTSYRSRLTKRITFICALWQPLQIYPLKTRIVYSFPSFLEYLRATIFHIPASSYFHIKEIAGNIIPAVASANAIVAGLQVINGIKLLMNRKAFDVPIYACRQEGWARTLSIWSKGLLL